MNFFPIKNKEIQTLFQLFFNEKAENKRCLLFAGKVCMFCLLSTKSFYNKLIQTKDESDFKNIPGRPEKMAIRRSKSKEIANEINKRYQNEDRKLKQELYYYCSCGTFYEVGSCGFPEQELKCEN